PTRTVWSSAAMTSPRNFFRPPISPAVFSLTFRPTTWAKWAGFGRGRSEPGGEAWLYAEAIRSEQLDGEHLGARHVLLDSAGQLLLELPLLRVDVHASLAVVGRLIKNGRRAPISPSR